jgi:hypothetical protein
MVDAKVLDVLLELLGSDGHFGPDEPRLAANMLEIVATHDFALGFLDLSFCTQLVSLLPQVSSVKILNSVLMPTQT